MLITENMKMADMIHHNYMLLPVINRFGINLGFGEKTVSEVCSAQNINVYFFLDIVNAYHEESYFPKDNLQSFSVEFIVAYLINTHKHYLNYVIPNIENLITQLTKTSSEHKSNLKLLNKFFAEYKNEITAHIEREESTVYPYALAIELAYESKKISETLRVQMGKYSINDYINQHDDIEEKLFDLKNIIIKYLPPQKDANLCNNILIKLFNFEKDINNHSRIEEKVMVPKIIKMEKAIKNMSPNNL